MIWLESRDVANCYQSMVDNRKSPDGNVCQLDQSTKRQMVVAEWRSQQLG